jgi:hypothetical protein
LFIVRQYDRIPMAGQMPKDTDRSRTLNVTAGRRSSEAPDRPGEAANECLSSEP